MASLLKLRQAARLIGVSPGRLYRAIATGRLTATPGGGPGKPTLVSLEALHTFCRSEGLRAPEEDNDLKRSECLERSAHVERSMSPADEVLVQHALEAMAERYLAQVIERQSDYFETFLKEELSHLVNRVLERVVDQVVERLSQRLEHSPRLERSVHLERSTPSGRSECSAPAISDPKAAVLPRLQAMRAAGMSLQAMADRLNAEGIPTQSGHGHWQKGTIGKLLAQGKATGR